MHIRRAITDVAGKCPYTDDAAEVLCKRIKLLFRKVGWKAVNVHIGNAHFARVGFSHIWYRGSLGINLSAGN
jgi:hypothetical protein